MKKKKKYNELLMKELLDKCDISVKDFADAFGITRQSMNTALKKAKKSSFQWSSYIPKEILEQFYKMIEIEISKKFDDVLNAHFYILYNRENKQFSFLFIPLNEDILPIFMTELNEDISSILHQKGFHLLTDKDFLLIQELKHKSKKLNDLSNKKFYGQINNLSKKFFSTNSNTKQNCKDFCDIKDIPYSHSKTKSISYDEMREILLPFYVPEFDMIKIPVKHKEYMRIVNIASNRGISLETLVKQHGFNYKKTRLKEKNKLANLQKELSQYLVTDHTIYLPSNSKIYYVTFYIAKQHFMSLDEFLFSYYGLKRIDKAHLPNSFNIPQFDNAKRNFEKEKEFEKTIKEHFMVDEKNGTFYIDYTTPFYFSVIRYCNRTGFKCKDLFESFGMKRLKYHTAFNSLKENGLKVKEIKKILKKEA